eukprot:321036_1
MTSNSYNYCLLWICSMCTYKNHEILKKCEMCGDAVSDQCEWVKEQILIHDINSTDNNENKAADNIAAVNISDIKPNNKRQRPYTDETSLFKKQKLSDVKLENNSPQVNIKKEHDGNIKHLQEMEHKLQQKYREKESRLQQKHNIEIQTLKNEIKTLQKENASLLTQNVKYKTTHQLARLILRDEDVQQNTARNIQEANDVESKAMDVEDESTKHLLSQYRFGSTVPNVGSKSQSVNAVRHDDNHNNKNVQEIDNNIAQLSPNDYGFNEDNNIFKCEYCPKTFKAKSHRNVHEKTHSASVYECKCCGVGFTQIEYYRQHLRTEKHKDKEKEMQTTSTTQDPIDF